MLLFTKEIKNKLIENHKQQDGTKEFNVVCKLEPQIIRWRNQADNWHGMDMYSKAQQKKAMLLLNDTGGSETCLNTGVIAMNKKAVESLNLSSQLNEIKESEGYLAGNVEDLENSTTKQGLLCTNYILAKHSVILFYTCTQINNQNFLCYKKLLAMICIYTKILSFQNPRKLKRYQYIRTFN